MAKHPKITSKKLKAARERLGETQAVFAERLGVDQATVHRWETKGVPARGAAQTLLTNVLPQLNELADSAA